MADKVQKIRKKVEGLFNHVKDSNFESDSGAFYYLKDLLDFMDSLQEEPTIPDIVDEHWWEMLGEEPVSEELENAAKYCIPDESYHMVIESKEEGSGENVYDYVQMINMFKAGANWKEQRMMAKAIDGRATFEFYGFDSKTYGTITHNLICLDDFGLKNADKVKVIIIKEATK